jgi:pimeloyl-ACP methyl ester carboxylesterase
MIRRAFADLPDRQVHYRHAGSGNVPLVMLHASPGSSKQLERLTLAIGKHRHAIAPDTPGNGDSTPLSNPAPVIADYAKAAGEFVDAMGLKQIDVYGNHTGASIAVELAILRPDIVRKVVLDGVGIFTDAERDEYLANYAPAIKPDQTGAYLNWAFMFCRDQYLFWPWYKRHAENSRSSGLPPANVIHDWVLEVLKSIETYHLGYRAAFAYPKRERLPLVTQPLLGICSENDPLLPALNETTSLAPNARVQLTPPSNQPGSVETISGVIAQFLDEV